MPSRALAEAVTFAFAGLGVEVAYTAVAGGAQAPGARRHLIGYSSLWYLPLYALVPTCLDGLGGWVFAQPWPLRGCVYMGVAWAAEYAGMGLLRLLNGASPSEASYRRSRFSIHGLTRLDHGPLYFAGGLAFEWLLRALRA